MGFGAVARQMDSAKSLFYRIAGIYFKWPSCDKKSEHQPAAAVNPAILNFGNFRCRKRGMFLTIKTQVKLKSKLGSSRPSGWTSPLIHRPP
jgi:hypothetical protein